MIIRTLYLFLALLVSLELEAAQGGPAPAPSPATSGPTPQLAAKSYVLYDYQSGSVLVSQNPNDRVEPASLTKLMTAYIAFEALRNKKLDLNQALPVSQRAWKAEGSRMFVDPKKPATVDELLHGMIIQSGNDASIAVAEGVAGSEEAFADMMNREAQRLGMKNSHFVNATGLPNPEHYATAYDLAQVAAAIIRDFPEFYKLYSIKEYKYNNISQPNRNRLLWIDTTVDGMKTGHTENAGFCLVASAKRGERRLVSVLLGAASDSARMTESQRLLNYGFQFFETERVFQAANPLKSVQVYKGRSAEVKIGFDRDVFMSFAKGDFARRKETLTTTQPLVAPIAKGQKVGTIDVSVDGKTLAQYPVIALEDVPLAGFFQRTWDGLRLMLR